jgi:hypothetical protein
MAKFTEFYGDTEVKTIMTDFVVRFPNVFRGFNVEQLNVVVTKKKKSQKPIRLISVKYPMDVYILKPYIFEVFEVWWQKLSQKQKNLAVFHAMCGIPEGGFDEASQYYGKKTRPDIVMYLTEFAAAGSIPNWLENDMEARDPMEIGQDDVNASMPVGSEDAEGEDEDGDPIPVVGSVGKKEEPVKRSPVTKEAIIGA